ncbi:MAG: Asp-tRNA(Asn)/Glu-tRNA(Gln) amidotransferase subunit GatA [Spirochaetales bacterium]|nr:Asp-tRNA(Asn)/Glu-tRNA(Gln) amidotransferase subunit GatA [Spirochaetales bacterium]
MSEITRYSLTEIKTLLEKKSLTSEEIVSAYQTAYENDNNADIPLNGYIEFFKDARTRASAEDIKRKNNTHGRLSGLPIAVKDNILITGKKATCGSKILEGFSAPYTATVIRRLEKEGAVFLGRTNMDEFAMGSSCEYSQYGPTRNPVNREYVPGGSSGGSAAVVGAFQAPAALGSDTGGSVRLPASFCGLYGLKPGYGTLSRYGLVAYGSSLDQIGIVAHNPADIALLLSVCAGIDSKDSTSRDFSYSDMFPLTPGNLKGLKVALPVQLNGEGNSDSVRKTAAGFIDWLKQQGADVSEISIPNLSYTVAIYYIIAPAEASSNLARYDGIEYGLRNDNGNLLDMYINTRSEGFGSEVKRRIFIGNYVLSSGYYDAYYKKAQAVRSLLTHEFDNIFTDYDIVLSPTSPTPPFKLGEKLDDPVTMYLQDICTIYANLVGIPAISIPAGMSNDNLPIGMQLAGRQGNENLLLSIAQSWKNRGGAA